MDRRLLLAAGAALAVVIAAPRGDVERAQGQPERTEKAFAAQSGAKPPMIAAGPSGRVALTGPWTLRGDKQAHGSLKGWQAGGFAGSSVDLPNSPNARRITGSEGLESFRGSVGWYRTTFAVPEDGDYALRFESVNHKAAVWLDGRQIASHTGEYLPFEEEVSLAAGREHTLVVRADWRGPTAMKRAAWHRTWFNFGGINREVTIRRINQSVIGTPTVRTRLQPDGTARVDLTAHVRNRASQPREIAPVGRLKHGDQEIPVTFPKIVVPPRETQVFATTVTVKDPVLWAPLQGNLYDVDLAVPGESDYHFRTGLREIRTDRGRLLVNGRPVELRGASIHEDTPGRGDAVTGEDLDQTIAELKQIGANATRAQHPLNPALLERLDAAGIMVWQGIGVVDAPGAWTSKTAKLRAQSSERVRTNYFQLQTHPSIITWNLANEIAGNGHPDGQAAWIEKTATELKRRDPGRPIALDVWGPHPPQEMGPMYRDIDLIGDTNYIGWYEQTLSSRAKVRQTIRSHIAKYRRIFKGKVIVVTEFGAEANGQNPTTRPGGYRFQADLLRLHIDIYRHTPGISGALVWNLRDFAVSPAFAGGSIRRHVPNIKIVRGLNQKGLFRYDGSPKPAVAAVRDALAGR